MGQAWRIALAERANERSSSASEKGDAKMHSWNSMKLLESVSRKLLDSAFRPRINHRYEWIAAGALLTCFAVVLNLSPFAKTSKREALRPATEQLAASAAVTRPQVTMATQPDRSQPNMEAANVSERLRPMTEGLSIPSDAFARLVFQPVALKDRDGAQQDRGTPDPATQPFATIVGVWVPDAGACSARNLREGLLPTIINNDGAWAGETFCIFKNQKQTETGWKVVAHCSNPREHWTTDVRLTVKDNRLTWASKRGTQVYTRCAPDFLLAAAR
jgi:hypothetical protein